jgi:microcompartment protein CcmK/EutM
MIICKVTGTVVSTVKHKELKGYKLLVVQPLDLLGNFKGDSFLGLDLVDAGEGDRVLVMKEGSSARTLTHNENIPVQAMVVGVIDNLEVEPQYLKQIKAEGKNGSK